MTDNEKEALKVLVRACLANICGATVQDLRDDPSTWIEASDLIKAGWTKTSAAGTLSALQDKGLVCMDPEESFVTTKGLDVAESLLD